MRGLQASKTCELSLSNADVGRQCAIASLIAAELVLDQMMCKRIDTSQSNSEAQSTRKRSVSDQHTLRHQITWLTFAVLQDPGATLNDALHGKGLFSQMPLQASYHSSRLHRKFI